MNTTTGIRLEVPNDLYEKLQDEQERRRLKTGKKPGLSAIIQEICSNKLDENETTQYNVHSVHDSVQISAQSNLNDSNSEKQLKQWEERLVKWEKSLQEREKNIKEQEKVILREKQDVLDYKSNVQNEREKVLQSALNGTEQIIELKLLQSELTHNEEKITRLQKELEIAKNKIQKNKENQKINKPKTLWEQIKEYLPYIATGISLLAAYFMTQKDKRPALPPVVNELAGLFEHFSETDQKILGEKLKIFVDNHSAPVKDDKIFQVKINPPA